MLSVRQSGLKNCDKRFWQRNPMKKHTTIKSLMQKYEMLVAFVFLLLVMLVLPVYAEADSGVTNSHKSVAESPVIHRVKANTETGSGNNSYMLQLFSGLMVVLLSIIALAWIAKRFNHLQPAGNENLQIVAGISMGAREKVVVVQAGDTKVLLGVAPGRINMLHVLEKNESTVKDDESFGVVQKNISENPAVGDDIHTFSQRMAAALVRKKT